MIDRKRGFLLDGKRRRGHNSEAICLGLISTNKILRQSGRPFGYLEIPWFFMAQGISFFAVCADVTPPALLLFAARNWSLIQKQRVLIQYFGTYAISWDNE